MNIILILFCLFIIFTIITHLFTFLFLIIEYKIGSITKESLYPEIDDSKFIFYGLKEYFLVMLKFILYPLKFRTQSYNNPKDNHNIQDSQKHVVLLIHGFCRAQTDWLWFQSKLAKLIPNPIYTLNLANPLSPIQTMAESLTRKIEHIKEDTNCESITLIGHSMGGLVSSFYAENLDIDNLVNKVIMIGSPINGTKAAVLGVGKNVKQMLPNSVFLSQLREKIYNSKKQYYTVASKMDNLIYPWYSAILSPADNIDRANTLVEEQESHLGLIYSIDVLKQVKDWL